MGRDVSIAVDRRFTHLGDVLDRAVGQVGVVNSAVVVFAVPMFANLSDTTTQHVHLEAIGESDDHFVALKLVVVVIRVVLSDDGGDESTRGDDFVSESGRAVNAT